MALKTMLFKNLFTRFFFATILLLVIFTLHSPSARAQFYDDAQLEEDVFMEEEVFLESYGDEYTGQPGPSGFGGSSNRTQSDFTEGSTYAEETPAPPTGGQTSESLTTSGRTRQLTLQGDKRQLPLNMGWGALTGLMIGGWFAMINEGDNRQTQRTIGTGIVLGVMLGATVGMRSLLIPTLPRAASLEPGQQPGEPPAFLPLVAWQDHRPVVGFRLLF